MKLNIITGLGFVVCTTATAFLIVQTCKERKLAIEEIVNSRTEEDKKLIDAVGAAKEAYNKLKASEAVKEVPVVIDINAESYKLSPISMRASTAVGKLRQMNKGIISGTTFRDAFEGIQDTEEIVKDILRKARERAVLESRTPEDIAVVRNFKELFVAEQDLYAKERGLVPGFFCCMHCFFYKNRKRIPMPVALGLMVAPIVPVIYLCLTYIEKATRTVINAYRVEAIK